MPVRFFPRPARLLLAVALATPLAAGSLSASAEEPAAAAAPAGDVAVVVKGVEAAYKDLQSLTAEFSQVTRSVAMGEGEVQKGTLAMERPRKMRWDFKVPDDKLFVTDGKTMWVYNPGDKQVIISEDLGGGEGDGDGMTELLDNLDSLGKYFDVEQVPGPEGTHTLSLKPKKENVQFKKLRLTLAAGDYTLQQLVVVDAFDTETELTFTNVQKNVDVADADFVFTVPDGVEVVRADGI